MWPSSKYALTSWIRIELEQPAGSNRARHSRSQIFTFMAQRLSPTLPVNTPAPTRIDSPIACGMGC